MAYLSKTNETSMLPYPLEDVTPDNLQYFKDALLIQDAMTLFHTFANFPPTFDEICQRVLDHMVNEKYFLFSTDSYHPHSIKAQKSLRRGRDHHGWTSNQEVMIFRRFLSIIMIKNSFVNCCYEYRMIKSVSRLNKTDVVVLIVEGRAYQGVSSNRQVRNSNSV